LSVESLIADSGKSGDYAVVGDAVVLVSGGGAVVNNIAVAVFGDVAVVVTGADVGWIGIALIVSKISS
jgi:hypothetical protein